MVLQCFFTGKQQKAVIIFPLDLLCVTVQRNIPDGQSNTNYDIGNEIVYSTEVLKSNHCDYNHDPI